MNKCVFTIAASFLLFGNSFGEISEEATKKMVATFQSDLTNVVDKLINSTNCCSQKKIIKELKEMLPTGPKEYGPKHFGKDYEKIEKDVFFSESEKNSAAIAVLEDALSKMKKSHACKKELNDLLKSQKSLKDEWSAFFRA